MNMKFNSTVLLVFALLMAACSADKKQEEGTEATTEAPGTEEKKKFTIAWSIYAGWQPWDYADQSGILKKWADKYNLDIELVKMDYIPSIEAYVAGQADACVMTNMEALDMPAASGVTSTAMILGDYSNGNDAILTRDGLGLADLKGKEINLVEMSVSHYLLSRALEMNGLREEDVNIVNTGDSDIAPAFIANTDQKAVVTWNPLVMEIKKETGVSSIFSSADIPEEVMDLMLVKTKVLEKSPELGKALAGAWYEVMHIMSSEEEKTAEAMTIMSESAGCTVEEYKEQLNTTAMFYDAQKAVDYYQGNTITEKMDYVRKFCFEHGLLGEGAQSVDEIGIRYPNGSTQGDESNIQLIFDATYMEMAAKNTL